jgi:hypothetical protein
MYASPMPGEGLLARCLSACPLDPVVDLSQARK